MTKTNDEKPPLWFWIAGSIALLWNIMGAMAYLQQAYMTQEDLAQLPVNEQSLYENVPIWVTAAFALAVWGGVFGCIALLWRKKWAKQVFLISLLGVLVQNAHSFFISNNFEVYGPGGILMSVMIIIIAVALVFLSKKAIDKNWIS